MNPAIIAALISGAASIGGGILSNQGSSSETKLQKQQRKLIDQLMQGLGGEGQYSDLFNTDEDAFNKSFVNPAMSKFNNMIAPGIQQQFISSGLQRGTGLYDSLQRAGVDMSSLLNGQYMDFIQSGKNRMQNMLGNILGQGPGAPNQLSTGQAAAKGAAGYLGSDSFSKSLDKIMQSFSQKQDGVSKRPGFDN